MPVGRTVAAQDDHAGRAAQLLDPAAGRQARRVSQSQHDALVQGRGARRLSGAVRRVLRHPARAHGLPGDGPGAAATSTAYVGRMQATGGPAAAPATPAVDSAAAKPRRGGERADHGDARGDGAGRRRYGCRLAAVHDEGLHRLPLARRHQADGRSGPNLAGIGTPPLHRGRLAGEHRRQPGEVDPAPAGRQARRPDARPRASPTPRRSRWSPTSGSTSRQRPRTGTINGDLSSRSRRHRRRSTRRRRASGAGSPRSTTRRSASSTVPRPSSSS